MLKLQFLTLFGDVFSFIGSIAFWILCTVVGIAFVILIVCALLSLITISKEMRKIRIILENSLLSDEEADEISEVYEVEKDL